MTLDRGILACNPNRYQIKVSGHVDTALISKTESIFW